MKAKILLLSAILVLMGLGFASAATDTATLNINANVNAQAKLSLSTSAITFANSDPDTVPSIPSTPATIGVTASVKTGSASTATLTWTAADDLKSGSDTIAISNVTWTASGTGYVAGTLAKTPGAPVASRTSSGLLNGTLTPFLANSWTYPTGTYTAASTFTLTAP